MSQAFANLLAAALKLSPEERHELADHLLDSLDPSDTGIDTITEEESAGIPWEQVREMR